jgi:hypothetical protein
MHTGEMMISKAVKFHEVSDICKYNKSEDYGVDYDCEHKENCSGKCERLDCPIWSELKSCQYCI